MNVKVTSVSRYSENLVDAASAIQVISDEDIRRSSAATLAETLRLANNLNVAQKNPHDWAVSARGFNANVGNKLLVLIDGRTVYTPLFAGVFWNAQDYALEDIERIEVISGPGSALWGANAVNGVINVITKKAGASQGWYTMASLGDELEYLTTVRYGGEISPDVHYRVYGKAFAQDDAVLASGARASDAWNNVQGGFRLDATLSDADELTFQGDAYESQLDMQIGGEARLNGFNALGRWTRQLSDNSDFALQLYVDRTDIDVPFAATSFAPAGLLKDSLTTYDLDFQHSLQPTTGHRFMWGFGYRFTHDVVEQQAPNVAYLPPRLDRNLFSVFLQDEFSVANDVAVTLGSKFEHNDYTGLEVEPTARIQWQWTPSRMLWGAVSRAVRMPSRFDTHLHEPAPPLTIIQGNPDFRSEEVIAYELGFRTRVAARFSGSVALFYNTYDHVRSIGITPVTLFPLVFGNDLKAETYGAELTGDFQVQDWWRVSAGLTVLREDVRVRPGGVDLQNALDETADPKHQVMLRSLMNLPGDFELDAALRWVDALRVNNGGVPAEVPAYAELDARLAWHASDRLEIALVGRNLLHSQHPEYGAPSPSREELQRSLSAKITWRY